MCVCECVCEVCEQVSRCLCLSNCGPSIGNPAGQNLEEAYLEGGRAGT